MAPPLLHSFRKSDSKNRHSFAEHLGNGLDKHESALEKLLILLAEDRCIVIVLVELLGKLVCVIRHKCWRMRSTSLCHLRREGIEYLDDTHFLRREFNSGIKYVSRMRNTLFISLSENGFYTGMSILYEWSCISVEVDRLLRVKEHCLARIHL